MWHLWILLVLIISIKSVDGFEVDCEVICDKVGNFYDGDHIGCDTQCRRNTCFHGCSHWRETSNTTCRNICTKLSSWQNLDDIGCTLGCVYGSQSYLDHLKDEVGEPDAPQVIGGTISNTSIGLRWRGHEMLPQAKFLVQTRTAHTINGWQFHKPIIPLKRNRVLVKNLTPFTKYQFRIAWIVLLDKPPIFSDTSPWISTIPSGPPQSSPRNVRAIPLDASRIEVLWDVPLYPAGEIISYTLHLEHTDKQQQFRVDIDNDEGELRYIANGLSANTSYIVNLSATNSQGEGPVSTTKVTTYPLKSAVNDGTGHLMMFSGKSLLKLPLDIIISPQIVFNTTSGLNITGMAVHVPLQLVYITDASGAVYQIHFPKNLRRILIKPNQLPGTPSNLTVDWLFGFVYVVVHVNESNSVDWQIWRFDLMGKNIVPVVKGLTYRPDNLEADPFHGYLWWISGDTDKGLHRLDALENISASLDTSKVIFRSDHLGSLTVDTSKFRVIVAHQKNHTLLSLSLDGVSVENIRPAIQQSLLGNVRSLTQIFDRFYWTNGEQVFSEELIDGKFYHNSYAFFTSLNIGKILAVHSSVQTVPTPLNAPRDVQGIFFSESVKITWKEPRLPLLNGEGCWRNWKYEVLLQETDENGIISKSNISEHYAQFYELKPSTNYSIKVRAYSLSGRGPWSTTFKGRSISQFANTTRLLWVTNNGLVLSDTDGSHAKLVHLERESKLNEVTAVEFDGINIFMCKLGDFCKIFTLEGQLTAQLGKLESVDAMSVDFATLRVFGVRHGNNTVTWNSYNNTEESGSFQLMSPAEQLVIDYTRGWIYFSNSYAVYKCTLTGRNLSTIYEENMFNGKQVYGLTIDISKSELWWAIRDDEGSYLYSRFTEEVQAKSRKRTKLPSNLKHGSLRIANEIFFWVTDQNELMMTDMNLLGTAVVPSHFKELFLVAPQYRRMTDVKSTLIPNAIDMNSIKVAGSWRDFVINWDHVTNHDSSLTYEVTISAARETASFIIKDHHIRLGWSLEPHSKLHMSIRGVTNWAIGPTTTTFLYSPSSLPGSPRDLRAFSSSSKTTQNSLILRWSSPRKTNGIIVSYKITHCWSVSKTKTNLCSYNLVDGGALQVILDGNWTASSFHQYTVSARTIIGEGSRSELNCSFAGHKKLPSLIVATHDTIGKYDVDFGNFVTQNDDLRAQQIAYLVKEDLMIAMDTNSDVYMQQANSSDTWNRITRLEGRGISIAIDWIGRRLFWLEVNTVGSTKVESYEWMSKRKVNLILLSTKSHHVQTIVASPLQNLLYIKEETEGKSTLMAHPLSNLTSYNVFDNIMNSDSDCNCPKSPSLSKALAVDSSVMSSAPIYVCLKQNTHEGHLKSSILKVHSNGCYCETIVSLSEFGFDGVCDLLAVDSTYLYCYITSQILLLTMPREGPTRKEDINSQFIGSVNSILPIDPLSQPFPRIDCLLVLMMDEERIEVETRETMINLHLPQPTNNEHACGDMVLPSGYFLVYYNELKQRDSGGCAKNVNLCKVHRTMMKNVTIGQLKSFTKYVFRIAYETPYNQLFNIPVQPSKPVYYTTRAAAPVGATDVKATAVSPCHIKVRFGTPLNKFYQIHWRSKPGVTNFLSSSTSSEATPHTSLILDDLKPSTKYQLWVRTFSDEDHDLFTDSTKIFCITLPTPPGVQLVNSSSTSLQFSWTSPTSPSIVSHSFQYKTIDGSFWNETTEELTISGNVYYPLISSLSPATTISLRSKLIYNTTQLFQLLWPKTPYQFTTLGDVPSKPGGVKIHKDGWKVWWEEANDNGSPIEEYELFISTKDNSNHSVSCSENFWLIDPTYDAAKTYIFKVRAKNSLGTGQWSQETVIRSLTGPTVIQSSSTTTILVSIIPTCILFFAVLSVCIFTVLRRSEKRWNKHKNASLGLNSIESSRHREVELSPSSHLPMNNNFVAEDNILYNMQHFTGDDIDLPHVSQTSISLTKFLGSGAFGEVYEGTASDIPGIPADTKVAIKTLRKGATENEKVEFMKEAKLMSHFNHEHILRLLAVCTDQTPYYLILELMEGGDLLSYLRANRHGEKMLTMKQLIGLCTDVAKGCVYLEEMHFVHRDIAARNCLVSSANGNGNIVKIGDFGLARDVYKNDYYRKEGEGLLPVRWMPPESLLDGVFTIQSDVWAFGVLLWEIMTLGQQPYPARTNLEVLHYVRSGGKPVRPPSCPEDLCLLMEQCWNYSPETRPSFTECLTVLSNIPETSMPMLTVHNINYLTENDHPGVYNLAFRLESSVNATLGASIEEGAAALPSEHPTKKSYSSETGGSGASTLPLNVPLLRQQQYLQLVNERIDPTIESQYEVPIQLGNYKHPDNICLNPSLQPLATPLLSPMNDHDDCGTSLNCSSVQSADDIPHSMEKFHLPMPSLPPRLCPVRRLSSPPLISAHGNPHNYLLSIDNNSPTSINFTSPPNSSSPNGIVTGNVISSDECSLTPHGYTSMTSNSTTPSLFSYGTLSVVQDDIDRRLSGIPNFADLSDLTASPVLEIEVNQKQSVC